MSEPLKGVLQGIALMFARLAGMALGIGAGYLILKLFLI